MDPMLIIPLLLIAALLVFMWRGNKKRAAQQQTLREQMVVGADVMTQAGIYGTIVEQDADNNVTTLEISPGNTIRVHTATVLNVLSPTVPDDASALADDGLPQPAASADGDRVADEVAADDVDAERIDEPENRESDVDPDAAEADDAEHADEKPTDGDDPLGEYRGDGNGPTKA